MWHIWLPDVRFMSVTLLKYLKTHMEDWNGVVVSAFSLICLLAILMIETLASDVIKVAAPWPKFVRELKLTVNVLYKCGRDRL